MLVICEDTSVAPFVNQLMLDEGLAQDEVVTIDSNAKGEVTEEEWKETKEETFSTLTSIRNPRSLCLF